MNPELIGSCSCLTKTPEVKYHDPTCRYRIISEQDAPARVVDRARIAMSGGAFELAEEVRAAIHGADPERDRMKRFYDERHARMMGYLDEECAKIDTIRERLIELYNAASFDWVTMPEEGRRELQLLVLRETDDMISSLQTAQREGRTRRPQEDGCTQHP